MRKVPFRLGILWFSATILVLLFSADFVKAQLPVPVMNCISVEDNGSLTVNWTIPSGTFEGFRVFYKRNDQSIFNSGNHPVSANSANLPVTDAQSFGYEVFLVTYDNSQTPPVSDESNHLHSMLLNVSNTGGIARLEWNKIQPGSNGVFNIFRKDDPLLPFPASPVGQVNNTGNNNNLVFTDTIVYPYCISTVLFYRVEFSSGSCVANSSTGSGSFSDEILPEEPVISHVTINAGGRAEVFWMHSPSADVKGYVVGRFESPNYNDYDTTGYFNSFLDDDNSFPPYRNPCTEVVTYTVKAMDLCDQTAGTISYLYPHNTILLTGETASLCDRKATLTWNRYNNMIPEVSHYRIFRSSGGGAAVEIADITATSANEYTFIDEDLLEPGVPYIYRVTADNGDLSKVSASCEVQLIPDPEPLSEFGMDYLTVTDNDHIDLHLNGDPPSLIASIEIKRSEVDGSSVEVIYSTPWAGLSPVLVSDVTARVGESSYYYSVTALDDCGFELGTTNISRSIFLQIEDLGNDEYRLSWNAYEDWGADLVEYSIFRIADGIVESGFPASVTPQTLVFNDFAGDLVANRTTYYVEAVRNDDTRSRSNEVLLPADAEVLIPNAFRPNGISPAFKPRLKNIESDSYHFAIYNRWGQLVFETNNPEPGWNGQFNGRDASQDIYAWILTFNDLTGRKVSKRGSVMLLR